MDHQVRHLKQSFVAPKIPVRLELILRTQFARCHNSPGKLGNYRASEKPKNRLFVLFRFWKKAAFMPFRPACGN